jgi:RNA polymerase sigma factor (sigma-70 family)
MSPAKLFEANRGLAIHLATKYAKRYLRVNLDDLVQEASLALWNAAQRHNPNSGCPFAPYAMKGILWALWAYVNAHGYAPKELPLEEPVVSDGSLTWGDVSDYQEAQREQATVIPEKNQLSRIRDVENLIRTLPTLTRRERTILRLQYIKQWPVPRIAKHLDRSASVVSTESARGIRKLRQAMTDLGFRALPTDAPVIGNITGRPPIR